MASPAPFRKLKPGPGLAADAVAADQRRRIHEAMISLVIERGYGRVTVRGLAESAGVSTHSFYGHYANLEECFGYICDATLLGALHRAASLSTAGGSWAAGVHAGVRSLMEDVARQPGAARVALVDGFSAGPRIEARVKAAVEAFERLLVDLMLAFGLRPVAPELLIAGMVAGTIAVARKTTVAGRAEELPGLADELSRWLLSIPHEQVEELLAPLRSRSEVKPRREPQPFPGEPDGAAAVIGDPRERVLRAVAKLAERDGFAGLDLPRIRAEAGVPRRQFDARFDGATDAFLESVEWVARSAAARAEHWAMSEDGSRRTYRLILALSAQAARREALARLVLVGILDPGRDGLLRREQLIALGADRLRDELLPGEDWGALAAQASLAAAWSIAATEAEAGRAKQLPLLAPLISYLILAPGSGPESASQAYKR